MQEMRGFLEQAYRIDQRINCKIEQVSALRSLASKATSTITDMPGSPNRNIHRMEDIILKIVDLENEINADIDELVDLKAEIMKLIKRVESIDGRLVLEKRYLCFEKWEQIAVEMGFSTRQVYRVHDRAIGEIKSNDKV